MVDQREIQTGERSKVYSVEQDSDIQLASR